MKKIALGLMALVMLIMCSAMVSACGFKCQNFTACCEATVTTYEDANRTTEKDEFQKGDIIYASLHIEYLGGQPWCSPEYCRDNDGKDKLKLGLNDSNGNKILLGEVKNYIRPNWQNPDVYRDFKLNTSEAYYSEGEYDFIFGGRTGFWKICRRRFGPLVIGGFTISVPEMTMIGVLIVLAAGGFMYMRKKKQMPEQEQQMQEQQKQQ